MLISFTEKSGKYDKSPDFSQKKPCQHTLFLDQPKDVVIKRLEKEREERKKLVREHAVLLTEIARIKQQ
ncbi:MAG: hypothetical protein LBC20_16260 [Planctomycetaceae bacterium]|nr:hypothetical protein [Planctomycetaceae bacterium]